MKYLYISIFILVFGYFNFLNPVRDVLHVVFAPFQFGLRELALDLKNAGTFFSGIQTLRQDNIRLTEENMLLRSELVGSKTLEEENDVLRNQLKLEQNLPKKLLLAQLIRDSGDLTGSKFIINRGSKDGVGEGNNIIFENYLVGVVTNVSPYRSEGLLVTSSDVNVAVYDVDSANKTEGLASGQFGSTIKVSRILPTEEVKIGDMMLTSGKDGTFLPGLLVGRVKEIEEAPAETLKSAFLETYVDLGKLQRVFILTD